jgi:holliday junction DNA helicase RuvA
MIGSLRGTLEEFEPSEGPVVELVIDVSGVGYRVLVSSRHAAGLATIGGEVHLAIHTHVREGAITLYGFANPLERRVFETLLGAHGIGPALALAILGVYPPATLAELVATGDIAGLSAVPGVGTKTAQRLVVDLGEQLSGLTRATLEATRGMDPTTRLTVRDALGSLGYGTEEIRSAIAEIEATDDASTISDPATLLRAALQLLAPGR